MVWQIVAPVVNGVFGFLGIRDTNDATEHVSDNETEVAIDTNDTSIDQINAQKERDLEVNGQYYEHQSGPDRRLEYYKTKRHYDYLEGETAVKQSYVENGGWLGLPFAPYGGGYGRRGFGYGGFGLGLGYGGLGFGNGFGAGGGFGGGTSDMETPSLQALGYPGTYEEFMANGGASGMGQYGGMTGTDPDAPTLMVESSTGRTREVSGDTKIYDFETEKGTATDHYYAAQRKADTLKADIDKLVTDGIITQEEANGLKAQIDNRLITINSHLNYGDSESFSYELAFLNEDMASTGRNIESYRTAVREHGVVTDEVSSMLQLDQITEDGATTVQSEMDAKLARSKGALLDLDSSYSETTTTASGSNVTRSQKDDTLFDVTIDRYYEVFAELDQYAPVTEGEDVPDYPESAEIPDDETASQMPAAGRHLEWA